MPSRTSICISGSVGHVCVRNGLSQYAIANINLHFGVCRACLCTQRPVAVCHLEHQSAFWGLWSTFVYATACCSMPSRTSICISGLRSRVFCSRWLMNFVRIWNRGLDPSSIHCFFAEILKYFEKKCEKVCRFQKNAYLCIRVREKRIRLNKLVR